MVLLAGIIVDQQQGMKFAVDIARGMEYLHSLEQLIPRLYLKSTHIMVSTRSDTRLGISQMLSIRLTVYRLLMSAGFSIDV